MAMSKGKREMTVWNDKKTSCRERVLFMDSLGSLNLSLKLGFIF